MDDRQALELIGGLPSGQIRKLFDVATPLAGTSLRTGVWLGRNGGMPFPLKRFVRHVVRREWFAKLILDGWGINLRVRQDGSHALLPVRRAPSQVKVDLPFRLTGAGLDYGFHILGWEPGPSGFGLQMRDFLREIDFRTLSESVAEAHLRRVGATRGQGDSQRMMVLGYIAPLGIRAAMSTPFGMVWHRDASPDEVRSAEEYVRTRRLWDSSRGGQAPTS